MVGRTIREEELYVRTVDSLGADDVDSLRVAGFDDPEMVLVHVLVEVASGRIFKRLFLERQVLKNEAIRPRCLVLLYLVAPAKR